VGLALYLEDYHPSVLLHCWLGHLTCKIVSEMTYNVSSGTLNPTIPYHLRLTCRWHGQRRISRGAGEAAAPPRVGQNDFFSGNLAIFRPKKIARLPRIFRAKLIQPPPLKKSTRTPMGMVVVFRCAREVP